MTVFIKKGDAPLSVRQAQEKGLRLYNSELAGWKRERGIVLQDPEYLAFAAGWDADNVINTENNIFNNQLAAYRAAVARLAQYKLEDGRAAIFADQWTGEIDPETGEEITESVQISEAVDPLPVQIEQADPDTGETVLIDNPAVVKDREERFAAQAIVDATPDEVKQFDEGDA